MSVRLADVPPTRYAHSAGAKIAYQVSGERRVTWCSRLGWCLTWSCLRCGALASNAPAVAWENGRAMAERD